MTKLKIIENNKLIAEFMGFPESSEYSLSEHDSFNTIGYKALAYHSSWDWLMPVVEKIEDFHYGVEYQVVIYEDEVAIIQKSEPKWTEIVSVSADGSGKLNNTWLAVVDFVKWYNQQNQKP